MAEGCWSRSGPPIQVRGLRLLVKDFAADTLLGHELRSLYNPAPQYREGQILSLSYHSIQDTRDLAGFIASVLPQAIEWFVEGRVANAIQTTPAHLRPKWLSTLGKLLS